MLPPIIAGGCDYALPHSVPAAAAAKQEHHGESYEGHRSSDNGGGRRSAQGRAEGGLALLGNMPEAAPGAQGHVAGCQADHLDRGGMPRGRGLHSSGGGHASQREGSSQPFGTTAAAPAAVGSGTPAGDRAEFSQGLRAVPGAEALQQQLLGSGGLQAGPFPGAPALAIAGGNGVGDAVTGSQTIASQQVMLMQQLGPPEAAAGALKGLVRDGMVPPMNGLQPTRELPGVTGGHMVPTSSHLLPANGATGPVLPCARISQMQQQVQLQQPDSMGRQGQHVTWAAGVDNQREATQQTRDNAANKQQEAQQRLSQLQQQQEEQQQQGAYAEGLPAGARQHMEAPRSPPTGSRGVSSSGAAGGVEGHIPQSGSSHRPRARSGSGSGNRGGPAAGAFAQAAGHGTSVAFGGVGGGPQPGPLYQGAAAGVVGGNAASSGVPVAAQAAAPVAPQQLFQPPFQQQQQLEQTQQGAVTAAPPLPPQLLAVLHQHRLTWQQLQQVLGATGLGGVRAGAPGSSSSSGLVGAGVEPEALSQALHTLSMLIQASLVTVPAGAAVERRGSGQGDVGVLRGASASGSVSFPLEQQLSQRQLQTAPVAGAQGSQQLGRSSSRQLPGQGQAGAVATAGGFGGLMGQIWQQGAGDGIAGTHNNQQQQEMDLQMHAEGHHQQQPQLQDGDMDGLAGGRTGSSVLSRPGATAGPVEVAAAAAAQAAMGYGISSGRREIGAGGAGVGSSLQGMAAAALGASQGAAGRSHRGEGGTASNGVGVYGSPSPGPPSEGMPRLGSRVGGDGEGKSVSLAGVASGNGAGMVGGGAADLMDVEAEGEAGASGGGSFQPRLGAREGRGDHGEEAGSRERGDGVGEGGHPATSVHATVIVDENEQAESEHSSTRSGASQPSRGGMGTDAEIVSQLCRASHSASPAPSATAPAAAIATGRVSRGTVVTSDMQLPPELPGGGQGDHAPRDSSMGMANAGPSTRSATISTNSGTVDMSIHCDSIRSGAGSQGGGAQEEDEVQENSRDGEARGEPPGTFDVQVSALQPGGEMQHMPPVLQLHQVAHVSLSGTQPLMFGMQHFGSPPPVQQQHQQQQQNQGYGQQGSAAQAGAAQGQGAASSGRGGRRGGSVAGGGRGDSRAGEAAAAAMHQQEGGHGAANPDSMSRRQGQSGSRARGRQQQQQAGAEGGRGSGPPQEAGGHGGRSVLGSPTPPPDIGGLQAACSIAADGVEGGAAGSCQCGDGPGGTGAAAGGMEAQGEHHVEGGDGSGGWLAAGGGYTASGGGQQARGEHFKLLAVQGIRGAPPVLCNTVLYRKMIRPRVLPA